MKKIKHFIILTFLFISCSNHNNQKTNEYIPDIVDLEGNEIKLEEEKGNVIILNLWATWCKPCKAELNTIAEDYDDWMDDTGVKLVAVSIDDARSSSRVEPYINAQGWDYQVLLDPNGDFKRAMNVNNVPHTFLLDGNGTVVWDHNNYSPGDEKELYNEVLKISK